MISMNDSRITKTVRPEKPSRGKPVIAFMFPGLGGNLAENLKELERLGDPHVEKFIARADRVTTEKLGSRLSELVRPYLDQSNDTSTDVARLFKRTRSLPVLPTVVAHSILYTLECALAETWMAAGVLPDYVCGYSLGEYAAAHLAGAFGFEEGLSLIIERASALSVAPRGGLASIYAPRSEVEQFLIPDVYVVAENSSAQTVIGGGKEHLANVMASIEFAGYTVQELAVEHAFHTPLMLQAASGLSRTDPVRIEEEASRTSRPRLISTLDGMPGELREIRSPEHWARHLCAPVQLTKAVSTLVNCETSIFLEVAPIQSLAPLLRTHLSREKNISVLSTVPSGFDGRSVEKFVSDTAFHLRELGCAAAPFTFENDCIDQSERTLVYNDNAASASAVPEENIHLAKIREIWAGVLECEDVTYDTNFFACGGDSLRAAQIVQRLKKDIGIHCTIRDIYISPTPRVLAGVIASADAVSFPVDDILSLPNGLAVRYQSRADVDYFYRSIFLERSYAKHGLHIKAGDTVMDIGANIGMFSMFAALEAPDVKLFSVEPVPTLFKMLEFNLADVCEDVTLLNVGVSDRPGVATITFYPNSPGMSSFAPDRMDEEAILTALLQNDYKANKNSVISEILFRSSEFMDSRFEEKRYECSVISVSEIIAQYNIDKIDFLKIDVQKYEMRVLGGIDIRHWPLIRQIAIEVHDKNGAMNEICLLLESKGYAFRAEQDSLYKGTDIFNIFAWRQ